MKNARLIASSIAIAACSIFALVPATEAQIISTQRAGQGLPPNQVLAPSAPGGMVLLGSDIYFADGAQGLRHFLPSDPANPDPVNTGILVLDTDQDHSAGGNTTLSAQLGGACFLFCSVGQVALDGNTNVYVPAYDPPAGGRSPIEPGVWHLTTPTPPLGAWGFQNQVAPNAGLGGNQPTAVVLGPDGDLYVGFLKNGDIIRITNPQLPASGSTQVAQKIGTTPNGRPVRGLAFVGSDLYIATSQNLAVIQNATAPTCTGGCNAIALADGFGGLEHVGLATDGINRIYMAVVGVGVIRYSIKTVGSTAVVSTSGLSPTTQAPVSYSFVAGHSNLMYLDRLGNLWIGDASSGGTAVNSGRLWYISAAQLATLPAFP